MEILLHLCIILFVLYIYYSSMREDFESIRLRKPGPTPSENDGPKKRPEKIQSHVPDPETQRLIELRKSSGASPKPLNPIEEEVKKLLKLQILQASKKDSPDSLEFLKETLSHPNPEISALAAQSLSASKNPQALSILLEHMVALDQDILTRTQSIREKKNQLLFAKNMSQGKALKQDRIHPPPAPIRESKTNAGESNNGEVNLKAPIPEKVREERPAWYHESKKLRMDHHRVCESIFKGSYRVLQAYRLKPPGTWSPEEIHSCLERMILDDSQDPRLRAEAVQSLLAFSKAPRSDLISTILMSREMRMKLPGMELIRKFGLREHVPRLEVEMMSLNPEVAMEAIYTLLDLISLESIPKIEHLKNHRNPLVRESAIYALERLKA